MRASCLPDYRLIVSIPPRHGKSLLVSKWWPVWHLSEFPEERVILASYNADFAAQWGANARDVMREHGAALGVQVRSDRSAAGSWETTGGGGMRSSGVAGSLTGLGANLAIIDDPVKNWEEAYSQARREKVWEWFRSTLYTRLEPGGSIVLVMTRWHHEDLAGKLLDEQEHGGERWNVLRFPALAEEDDPLGRRVGEALWPARYGAERLGAVQQAVGPMVWAGLYQQRPMPLSGGLFPADGWATYLFPPPLQSLSLIVQSWDMTFDDAEGADYVVGQVWGFTEADAWLLDQVRGKMNFDATVEAVRGLRAAWPATSAVYFERAANAAAVASHLRSQLPGIETVVPDGSKEARAVAVAPFVHTKNVHVPHPDRCPWSADFIAELAAFPRGRHDDQVDAMTQALIQVFLTGMGRAGSVDAVQDELLRPSRWRFGR